MVGEAEGGNEEREKKMRKGEGRGNGVGREEWKEVEWSGGDEAGIEVYEKEP